MRRVLCVTVGVLLHFSLAIQAAAEGSAPLAEPPSVTPRIVNGLFTSLYPTTGVLLDGNNPNTASMICSGTMIGCQTFLTAAHCVEASLDPDDYLVFLQHAGFFQVTNVALHPDYDFPIADVAVLTLIPAVNGIAPTPINTTAVPPFGTSGTIVGFGRRGGPNFDYGLKRVGAVVTAACSNGISDTTSVCWDFENPLGNAGEDSNTCNGDSGGPLFVDFGAGMTVAGVTSGGNSFTCEPADNSFDANVFYYSSWIQAQGGADLNNTSCGTLSQVGSAGTQVTDFVGVLTSAASQALHTIEVPPGQSQLRITMNGVDDGSDFDIYVRFDQPPTPSLNDCEAEGLNQYAFCGFASPSAGTWYVLVNRYFGSGAYQVTATTFGAECGAPGSEGQPCSDGNTCTAGDVCQGGTCVGSPLANGTACNDGNTCTAPDACQAGICIGTEEPRTDCIQPFISERGLLRMKKVPGKPQTLKWNWSQGSLTTKAQFGTPTVATHYDLCVFDQVAGVDQLLYQKRISAGGTCSGKPCWVENTKGYRFRDSRGAVGNITSLVLKEGVSGKASIKLNGKGPGLNLPGLPLAQESTVTVQLSNGATCWQAPFSTNRKNLSTEFSAKPD